MNDCLEWHARYELMWGHKVSVGRNEQKEVTRAEYNEVAGAETPEQPAIPFCANHVWQWWWELNTRRQPGFDNLAPISYSEIGHWLLLTGKQVTPEEISWLIQMDNTWISAIATERNDKAEREKERSEIKSQGR